MKALVISGGGSKGAYAGGVAEYLIEECGNKYGLFIGTSTGSLLAPLLASNNLEKAKSVFTNVTQKDIFTKCPFIFERRNGVHSTRFNHWAIILMFLRKEKTLGDSHNLKNFISEHFSENMFLEIKAKGINVITTVANFTKQTVEYKALIDCNYSDFCDWIWASANVLPFMSLVTKDNCEYGDGGFGDLIPIQKAISMGATSIDVIILRPAKTDFNFTPVSNPLQMMFRTNDFMSRQIGKDDILIGELSAMTKHVEINYYYTPRVLAEHSFVFESNILKQWWQEGFDYASQQINR